MNEIQELIEIAAHAKGFDLKLNINELELFFYETYLDWCKNDPEAKEKMQPQVEIGPYRVDFLYLGKYVVELDGHQFHSSKKQRQHDCQRARYLQQLGYTVIRYTSDEVMEYPRECITQMMEIVYTQKAI